MPTITTTALPMAGGQDAVAGTGEDTLLTFAGTWAADPTQPPTATTSADDAFQVVLTDSLTGQQVTLGQGNVSGVFLSFVMTYGKKIYGLSGDTMYFCAVDEATTWNDLAAAGNGFEELANNFGVSENLIGVAVYQGKLAVVSRRTVQIWKVDPDPDLNSQVQVLPNIGSLAKLSIQPVGDMDIYMLGDNGVRSVRVRDSSGDAIIADIGTPIDAILQSVLLTLTDTQKATACAVVDPSSNRYMLFVPDSADDNGVGKIYVFSYFPSSQIAAWSTYSPSYQSTLTPTGSPAIYPNPATAGYTGLTVGKRYAWTKGAHETKLVSGSTTLTKSGSFTADATTATVTGSAVGATLTGTLSLTAYFTPEKFLVQNGQVYVRGAGEDAFYQYGGTDNNTYENCGVTVTTPYIDGQSPATKKPFGAVDAGFEGSWQVGASADYTTQKFKTVVNSSSSTFIRDRFGYGATGTHYAFQMIEDGTGYARFSSVLMMVDGPGSSK